LIRRAIISDEPMVFEMVRKFYNKAFSEFNVEFKEETAHNIGSELIKNHLVFVACDGDKVIGCIGGFITPSQFDAGSNMFQETLWYIDEAYRTSRDSLRLFSAVEDHCKDNGITHIIMASLGNRRDESLARFYDRRGYTHFETTYIKSIGG